MIFSDYATTIVVYSVQSVNSGEIRTNFRIKGNKNGWLGVKNKDNDAKKRKLKFIYFSIC